MPVAAGLLHGGRAGPGLNVLGKQQQEQQRQVALDAAAAAAAAVVVLSCGLGPVLLLLHHCLKPSSLPKLWLQLTG